MSYCRFSDGDVYVYEDVSGGWTTHVAARRRVFGKLKSLDFRMDPAELVDLIRRRTKWLEEHNQFVDIGLEHDGATFRDPTPAACAERLEALRDMGYDVPHYAIDALREEANEG